MRWRAGGKRERGKIKSRWIFLSALDIIKVQSSRRNGWFMQVNQPYYLSTSRLS